MRFLTISALALSLFLSGGASASSGLPTGDQTTLPAGQDLYQRLSCRGCHILEGQGGRLGPALDGVGSRLSQEDLARQLRTPRQRQGDSRMPSFAFLGSSELQTLLDFLETLK